MKVISCREHIKILTQHLFKSCFSLGERPFVCPYTDCGRSFTTSNIRKVHLRTHTGEKPYKCEIESCGRTFASATNYKNHSRIHTGFSIVPSSIEFFYLIRNFDEKFRSSK